MTLLRGSVSLDAKQSVPSPDTTSAPSPIVMIRQNKATNQNFGNNGSVGNKLESSSSISTATLALSSGGIKSTLSSMLMLNKNPISIGTTSLTSPGVTSPTAIDREAHFQSLLSKFLSTSFDPYHFDLALAVDAKKLQPNVDLNSEIVDMVRSKPARGEETLKFLLPVINGFSKHRAWLALCLLDMLSIGGGYAMRMLLSKRDHLNKLVSRFPAKPPKRTDEIQTFVLYLMHKWKVTFWERSKELGWEDDFEGIGAMHELLESKGFLFPNIPQQDLDAMTFSFSEEDQTTIEDPEASLEMERMTAKLELLFIRGTPTDLNAANELIKAMANKHEMKNQESNGRKGEQIMAASKKPSSSELLVELFGPVVTEDFENEQEQEEEVSKPFLRRGKESNKIDSTALYDQLMINEHLLVDTIHLMQSNSWIVRVCNLHSKTSVKDLSIQLDNGKKVCSAQIAPLQTWSVECMASVLGIGYSIGNSRQEHIISAERQAPSVSLL